MKSHASLSRTQKPVSIWTPPQLVSSSWLASPAAFASRLSEGRWRRARWLDLLSRWLVEAALGKRRRIIVEAPPRHGKSELVSAWFPAWYLDLFPAKRVILASYEADFAAGWGRRVRNILTEHREALQVRLSDDSTAANRWHTTAGGGMTTAGVDGPITGKGAELFIVDDPVKNMAEARSEVIRQRTWDWWQSTARTRFEPGASAVVLMTRWHEGDLAGLLQAMAASGEGEHWDVLRLPAFAEEDDPLGREIGEPLWPARYDLEALEGIRKAVGSFVWGALFQQAPQPLEGGLMFKRGWFKFCDAVPAGFRRVRRWDLAATEEDGRNDPDWTVGVKMAAAADLTTTPVDGRTLVEDAVRLRGTPYEVEQTLLATANLDGRDVEIHIPQDPGQAGKAQASHLATLLRGFTVRFEPETGDKVTRAGPWSAQVEAGNVYLVRGKWNEPFIRVHEAFPTKGAHDDDVDAAAGGFAILSKPEPGFGWS